MVSNTKLMLSAEVDSPGRLAQVANILFQEIGEDPHREGLQRTPERFAKAMMELTAGYALTGLDAIGEGVFESESSGPVCVNNIEFFSLCEHHMLPFWGTVSVAYLPSEKIIGLSKLGRVVDVFSKRLQVQERLTAQIGECIKEAIRPRAIVVTVQAQHMCMMMRGVKKVESSTDTEFLWKSNTVDNFEMSRLLAQIHTKAKCG